MSGAAASSTSSSSRLHHRPHPNEVYSSPHDTLQRASTLPTSDPSERLQLPRRSSTNSLRSVSSADEAADEHEDWLAHEVEPGVDVRRSDFTDIFKKDLSITVADWSAGKAKVETEMDNPSFLLWLSTPRPPWSKARWINLNNGLSWDVVGCLEDGAHAVAVAGRCRWPTVLLRWHPLIDSSTHFIPQFKALSLKYELQ